MRDRPSDSHGDGQRPRVPQQVTRLLAMFLLFGVALLVARHFLVPSTFGDIGHYRAAAIPQIAGKPIKYAGRESCGDCHSDVVEAHDRGRHQFVGCETCHGPAAAHTENPTEVKPRVPRERDFCPRCHGYDPSRPTGFPQIEPASHNPGTACVTCHTPHAPAPPSGAPSTCAACHGEIARTKAASRHAAVPCIRCHQVPDQHKETPRTVAATKPATRDFCGGCHAKGAAPEVRGPKGELLTIPQIDMSQHNPRFLCQQCHYPHSPEVR